MFKYLSRTLLTGFITLLPIVLTIYLLYWLAMTSEELMGGLLKRVLVEDIYFPGLGMLVGVVVVFFVGLMMNAYLVRQLFGLGEKLLYQLPLIKSVYRAFRDFFDFFSPKKEGLGQVVAVTFKGIELVGFITQDDPQRLPPSFRDRDSVLVYLPMSYMVGGYTILVSRDDLRPLQMSRDEAMRFVLTAGITGQNIE
ncbi:hypothetical protein BOW53_14650 [Solemya pervernicosa gill symbiont]|uniref:DUF502 domain-containing protein n=1 Tax=Solemya pervernicosa gill symbiont TaxID=642797 RepID=A0A1T2L0P8_9GAMM|nr:DUF502 domain-containing protein [Solemya pervernicosa gill symbiont]OOZ38683.1 hypothetical protein BOW53_14650 [Solemya pervernicosa gill symbiont]